jgi:N-acetylglucosamine-6-sulfatase
MSVLGVLLGATLALAVILGILLGGRGSASFVAPGSPNVVVVMTDDQTIADMRVMKATKRLFAKRGVSFSNSFASFPLCCPSRVTFLTGQYAHNHGVKSNKGSEDGGYEHYDDSDSLPITLQDAGYRTGFIGKYLNGYKVDAVPEGWDHWAGKKGGIYDYDLNVDGEVRHHGSRPRDYQTDVVTRMASDFIAESAGDERPFFLWASFHAPHGEKGGDKREFNPRPARRHRGAFRNEKLAKPESFDERDVSDKPTEVRGSDKLTRSRKRTLEQRVRSRRASLLAVDEAVERIVASLGEAGVEDNTYVILTSDNGYMFGEHRQSRKTLLYEESIRVPLMALGPRLPEGASRDQVVANIDLAPTIYDVTGVEPGRDPDGISLIPLAQSPKRSPEREILIQNQRSHGVRAPGWVYMEHERDGTVEYELYDLSADPRQLENLVDPGSGELLEADARHEGQLSHLRDRLSELRDCAGEECR